MEKANFIVWYRCCANFTEGQLFQSFIRRQVYVQKSMFLSEYVGTALRLNHMKHRGTVRSIYRFASRKEIQG